MRRTPLRSGGRLSPLRPLLLALLVVAGLGGPLERSLEPVARRLGLRPPVGATAQADEEPVVTLQDAQPVVVRLKSGRSTWTGRVEVPPGAVALGVVAASDSDVDLFVKRSRPVLDSFETEADAFRRGESPAEVLLLERGTRPGLLPGTWFVTVEHLRAAQRGAQVTVAVLLDLEDGPRTVLPGHPVVATAGGTGPTRLRTFLPAGARALRAALQGRGAEGATLEVRAPGGFARRSGADPSVAVESGEAPPGPLDLEVRDARAEAPARRLTLDVAWEFPPLPAPTDAPWLTAGSAEVVVLGGDSPHARLYRVDVPAGRLGFVLEEHNDAHADVDLYVRRDAPPEVPERDAEWLGIRTSATERLVVRGARPLVPGTYFVQVGIYAEGPVMTSLLLRWIEPAERVATWGAGDLQVLPPRTWTAGRTAPAESGITWYAVDPPAGVRSLHALLLDATAPLDLVLARRTDGSVLARAVTGRVDERLDHAFPAPLPAERGFLLGVMSLTPGEGPVDYRVALAYDAPPDLPADLAWPRLLPLEGLAPVERVAAATVELTGDNSGGGSATCVSPRGLLLSCRHVLEDPEEPGHLQREGILVAFNRALDRPPAQCYLARLVLEDTALDLALLELTEDVFGRALPPDLSLPWVPLGDSDALRLGDPVTVLGYPQEGSEFTRTPVILSRGSVSGFESAGGRRTWLKTDAWIGPGHSGGTLVDAAHRLVGVPAATLGSTESMGLCLPVNRLPEAWRARISRDLR